MEYAKPFLSFEQQADLLIEERGMVADRGDLIRHLQSVGYYRLSGYWYMYTTALTPFPNRAARYCRSESPQGCSCRGLTRQ